MFWTVTQSLLNGLLTTFQIFIWTLVFALPLGLVFAFASMSKWKPLRLLMQLIVWVVRGGRLMLQLVICFFGPGGELTFAGYSFMKSDGLTWPLFYTGVFYLLFVGILTLLFNYIERKLDYFK